jgi:hypothetical protein
MLSKTGPLRGRVVPKGYFPTFFPKEESNMKRSAPFLVAAFLTFLPLGAQAQNTDSASQHGIAAHKGSTKPTSLSGQLGSDGKTLTADRDRRIWKVSNPEILSGIDARHVRIRAHVDATRGLIHILSVSAIADERAGVKLDDAAFRR